MNSPKSSLVWGVTDFNDVPNVVMMGCLLLLLLILARRYHRMRIRLWIVALGIVFIDQLVWLLPHAQTTLRTFTHSVRLIGELLTGLTFLFYEPAPILSLSPRRRIILANAPAFVALQLIYGLNIRTAAPYVLCSVMAVLVYLTAYRRREASLVWFMVSLPFVWVGIALLALAGDFRTAAYSAAAYVFLAATRSFWGSLRKAYVGRAVVTGSLLLWAASLLVHPWVMLHPHWTALAEQTWAMQKFIVTFGMVVALFEEESREHEHLSHHDNLTGLANRRRLQQALQNLIASGSASVLLIDLNGFKQVNDQHGHAAGDCVLTEVSRRLLAICQPGETVARVGGDEFIIVSGEDLGVRENVINDILQEPIRLPSGTARVSGSLGLAVYPADAEGRTGSDAVSSMLNVADLRMYTAKHRHAARNPGRRCAEQILA